MVTTLVRNITFQLAIDVENNTINVKGDFKNNCSLTEFTAFATTIIEEALTHSLEEDSKLDIEGQLRIAKICESISDLKQASFEEINELLQEQNNNNKQ